MDFGLYGLSQSNLYGSDLCFVLIFFFLITKNPKFYLLVLATEVSAERLSSFRTSGVLEFWTSFCSVEEELLAVHFSTYWQMVDIATWYSL